MKVSEIMSTNVVTVKPDMTLKAAARAMVSGRISGLPVVDDDDHLVGILTEADFIHHESDRGEEGRAGLLGTLVGLRQKEAEFTTVAEAMTEKVVTVSPDESHTSVARLMEKHRIKRLPVVDDDGRVVGIVSRLDVMAAFTRPDGAIANELRTDIVNRLLMLDPETISIDVTEGLVTLRGSVPSRTDAEVVEGLAKRLDGVVGVESHLEYDFDDTRTGGDSLSYRVRRPNW